MLRTKLQRKYLQIKFFNETQLPGSYKFSVKTSVLFSVTFCKPIRSARGRPQRYSLKIGAAACNFIEKEKFFPVNFTKFLRTPLLQKTFGRLTAQKMKFSIKDFFSKGDQIRRKLKKSLMETFIFCAVTVSVSPL